MTRPQDIPLTPVDVERKLRGLVTELTTAKQELAQRRDACTEAEILLKRAKVTAAHSDNCPRPTRGGVTVAEREAWLDTEVIEEWEAFRRAETAKEIAWDASRTVHDIASVVQSIAGLVKQAFSMAGQS